MGVYEHRKRVKDKKIVEIHGKIPPIIDEDIFYQCQDNINKNKRNYYRSKPYLFVQKLICPKCGRQVEEVKKTGGENIVINNTNTNTNQNIATGIPAVPKNKWVALLLCIFTVCGHKFYEGKIGMGILYLFTAGLFGIGWFIDIISLLCKPNPYYVYY